MLLFSVTADVVLLNSSALVVAVLGISLTVVVLCSFVIVVDTTAFSVSGVSFEVTVVAVEGGPVWTAVDTVVKVVEVTGPCDVEAVFAVDWVHVFMQHLTLIS